jgi:hypothetical protein
MDELLRPRPPWSLPIALRALVGHLLDRLGGREYPPRLLVILVDALDEAVNARQRRVRNTS